MNDFAASLDALNAELGGAPTVDAPLIPNAPHAQPSGEPLTPELPTPPLTYFEEELSNLQSKPTLQPSSAPDVSVPASTSQPVDAKQFTNDFIFDEIEAFKQNAKNVLSDVNENVIQPIVEPVIKAKRAYDTDKFRLEARVSQLYSDALKSSISDEDKELFSQALGTIDPETSVENKVINAGLLANTAIQRFKSDALDPLRHSLQRDYRLLETPYRELIREHAPSVAMLRETFLTPLTGPTGWSVTNAEMDPETLDSDAQKLLNDKASLVGSEAGAALLSAAAAYRDLPLWLIGGSSKLGMMLGGAATEIVEDEGNVLRGAATGLVAGTLMNAAANSKVARKGINLMEEGVDRAVFKFGGSDASMQAFHNSLSRKYGLEPLMITSNAGATKLADAAASNVDEAITDIFKTQRIAPQALVLDIMPDGAPKVYGVRNGKYGELPEDFRNPEGRPVIITQHAKRVWADNDTARGVFSELTGLDKNRAKRSWGVDEWDSSLIPPENPALVFAWKDGDMATLYRAGSHQFTADLMKARVLSEVHYDGPDGKPTVGLGYFSPSGVVFAPDIAENIPGAIPHDLIIKRTRMHRNVQPDPISPQQQAWEIHPITDDEKLFGIIDAIRGVEYTNAAKEAEMLRGGMFPNGIPTPDKRPPLMFDNLPDQPGTVGTTTKVDRPQDVMDELNKLNMQFLPLPSLADVAKIMYKIPGVKQVQRSLVPATAYGEKFKIDASIQAFSMRHYKRLIPDMAKQLERDFAAASTPAQRTTLRRDITNFLEGHTKQLPPQASNLIQGKINRYNAERISDYAQIQALGGQPPSKAADMDHYKLEKLFIRDVLGESEWAEYLGDKQFLSNNRASLISLKKKTPAGDLARDVLPDLFGRQSIERELANDYFKRKIQLNTLTMNAELAKNPKASSSFYNPELGHTKHVDFENDGLLHGRYIDEDTYNGVFVYPKEQEMTMNIWRSAIDVLKYNKTVLNPATWTKNIMGNVYGTMLSNIVPTEQMAWRMPMGVKRMRQDLKHYEHNIMSNAPAVQRVQEALKFGLLGAEFEGGRGQLNTLLNNMENSPKKDWADKLQDAYYNAKGATIDELGNLYSSVDMATKYALYVNGLERWGISMERNRLDNIWGRYKSGKLLGYDAIANRTDDEVEEMIKREVVRRIHLTLPMVDRTAPFVTSLSKLPGIFNPWMRTALELARITAQIPQRVLTERGFALNTAKTTGMLGLLFAFNQHQRRANGISDEAVNDAWAIAPDNIKKFMNLGVATPFRASDGGIAAIDLGDMLIESSQWFGLGNPDTPLIKRPIIKLLDTVTSGGVMDNEAKLLLSGYGLAEPPQAFNTPQWKQGDWQRTTIELLTKLGPQIMNNGWNLYNLQNLPPSRSLKMDKPQQPLDIQILKSIGIDIASIGTEEQKRYQQKQLNMQLKTLKSQKRSANRQNEGSSTGPFQELFNKKEVKGKIDLKKKEVQEDRNKLNKAKPTP